MKVIKNNSLSFIQVSYQGSSSLKNTNRPPPEQPTDGITSAKYRFAVSESITVRHLIEYVREREGIPDSVTLCCTHSFGDDGDDVLSCAVLELDREIDSFAFAIMKFYVYDVYMCEDEVLEGTEEKTEAPKEEKAPIEEQKTEVPSERIDEPPLEPEPERIFTKSTYLLKIEKKLVPGFETLDAEERKKYESYAQRRQQSGEELTAFEFYCGATSSRWTRTFYFEQDLFRRGYDVKSDKRGDYIDHGKIEDADEAIELARFNRSLGEYTRMDRVRKIKYDLEADENDHVIMTLYKGDDGGETDSERSEESEDEDEDEEEN